MNHVTYKLYRDNEVIKDKIRTACFIDCFDVNWDYIIVKMEKGEIDDKYFNFWKNICKEIEPSIEYLDDNYVKVPYLGSKGKTLMLLILLRYAWESGNGYTNIPIMTYKILKLFPDMDKLSAITLANCSPCGIILGSHSIITKVPSKLLTINDYKDFNGNKVFNFYKQDDYGFCNTINKIKNKQKNKTDVRPILEHFNLIKENAKISRVS